MKKLILAVITIATLTLAQAAPHGRVNVLDFREFVTNPNTEKEDWQPAFAKAVEKAYATTRCLYVPAGEYPINKAIDLWCPRSPSFIHMGLTVQGDGRYASIIIQKNKQENCINWTGRTYAESLNCGTIKDMCVLGGKIALNLKWHNQFTMESCYVGNGSLAGIWAEGWSNRFINIVIRHCPTYGFRGVGHFNDVTIRDGYFSRVGVGIALGGGARGVRISGLGFEHSVICAISLVHSFAIDISDCYFEDNAMTPPAKNTLTGSIVLDHHVQSTQIQNCIFRGTAISRAHIAIGQASNVQISGNISQLHHPHADAIVMLADPTDGKTPAGTNALNIHNNQLIWSGRLAKTHSDAPPHLYYEIRAGMIQQAIANRGQIEQPERTRLVPLKSKKSASDAQDFQ